MKQSRLTAFALVSLLLFIGCAEGNAATSGQSLRLGYFPNVTHATAIVGVVNGTFARSLGSGTTLQTVTFNAGPEAVEALFAGSIDATYIGPNPSINAFIKSNGQAVRIIAGATSGGAFLVVRDGIDSADDLRGKKVASPQLGNTQDVALRSWLASQGMATDAQGGGDVSITPQANSQTLDTFRQGQVDGAWVPEPWATQLINAGGHVLVDERDLWPDGKYVTTLLIVRTEFLTAQPDVVKRLLQAHVEATDYVSANAGAAQAAVATDIGRISGSTVAPAVLAGAWSNLTFTVDPIASSLQKSADSAQELGFLQTSDLDGIFDLTLLNEVLRESGKAEVVAP